jgi:nitroreductase
MNNQILDIIKNRRSISKFEQYDISKEELGAILEAGRWAPSHANSQPWRFIVVQDPEQKRKIAEIAKGITFFNAGVQDASVIVAVCVNQDEDPAHYVEDGAAAVQNMSLMAHGLGLASYWIGSFQLNRKKELAEKKLKNLLNVPNNFRVIALLPIGKPAVETESRRKDLSRMVFHERYEESERPGGSDSVHLANQSISHNIQNGVMQ